MIVNNKVIYFYYVYYEIYNFYLYYWLEDHKFITTLLLRVILYK